MTEEMITKEELASNELFFKSRDYYNAKEELDQHQAALWLSTDFKAEGLTNDSMRKAFITIESKQELEDYHRAKTDYEHAKRQYELSKPHKKEIIVL